MNSEVSVDPCEELRRGELQVVPGGGVEDNLAILVGGLEAEEILLVPEHHMRHTCDIMRIKER